ncbi:MAG TPA: 50S ribosomal protein L23 [Candidatus Woesebacteria bacterium]|nr:50S ribosomal protein L23 [Candidatus Woesebacteria bacterium]HRS23153.1 50S ribosomal protein L23 [Candidatus Woesebacteria bacterium]HRT39805.1 50S ribosomal protein L23 [Candidatus Woesebacteria bacterium]
MILNKPIVTEKALINQQQGRYTFLVASKANKFQIAIAFEQMFGIKPLRINTRRIKGKVKTNWQQRRLIKKTDRKIAVITLPKDKKIDILTIKTKK